MNYSRWLDDMNVALDHGNTEAWVKTVSKMFEVDRVTEEIKTSTYSKATCLACKFLINLGRHMMKSGKSDDDILKLVSTACTVLKIQKERVCRGTMNLIGVSFCSLFFSNILHNSFDNWRIIIECKEDDGLVSYNLSRNIYFLLSECHDRT